jgi:uncharacterized membrane protein
LDIGERNDQGTFLARSYSRYRSLQYAGRVSWFNFIGCPSTKYLVDYCLHLRDAGRLSIIRAREELKMKNIIRIVFIIGGILFVLGCCYHLFPGMSGIAFTAGKFQFSYSAIAAIALISAAAYGFGGTKRSRR